MPEIQDGPPAVGRLRSFLRRPRVQLSLTVVAAVVLFAALVFPKLALGVSGFETGVSVMPLVRGDPHDDPERPQGRIRNTRKLLNSFHSWEYAIL